MIEMQSRLRSGDTLRIQSRERNKAWEKGIVVKKSHDHKHQKGGWYGSKSELTSTSEY